MSATGIEERLERLENRLARLEQGPGARGAGGSGERAALCTLPAVPPREYGANLSPHRLELLIRSSKKWVNGTRLHYHFFQSGSGVPSSWIGAESQRQAVREAFDAWKALGIGLEFEEVGRPEDAEVKVGFEPGGSWSYVGRDVIDYAGGAGERSMNFGWDLTTPYGRDTALHEIGHTLGFPHEHQNPNAGIVWDEAAVLAYFAGPPNYWSEAQTRRNVLDKLPVGDVAGSNWDENSIMHYQFDAGLIVQPQRYQSQPLIPQPGLSDPDIAEVRRFYPLPGPSLPELRPFEVKLLDLDPGEQANFAVLPTASGWFEFRTFGHADTVMVLFEEENGQLRYRTGDDDSGYDRNAAFGYRLVASRRYVLRVRLFWAAARGRTAVMMW